MMIEWLAVILLIAVGIGLVVAEVIFIPGVTVVGLLGLVFVVAGILITFVSFDSTTGFIILGVTIIAGLSAIFIGLKSNAWDKFSLKTTSKSKFNEDQTLELHEGESGIAVSALRPMGKAEFKDRIYEVATLGNYLRPGARIKIIRIMGSKIIVEPINE
jgi:membrane-bound ClpP family serine protease